MVCFEFRTLCQLQGSQNYPNVTIFFNLGGYVVLILVPVMSHVFLRNLFENLHFFLIMLLYLTAEPVDSFALPDPEIELTTLRVPDEYH